jgi:hypothetical protein
MRGSGVQGAAGLHQGTLCTWCSDRGNSLAQAATPPDAAVALILFSHENGQINTNPSHLRNGQWLVLLESVLLDLAYFDLSRELKPREVDVQHF